MSICLNPRKITPKICDFSRSVPLLGAGRCRWHATSRPHRVFGRSSTVRVGTKRIYLGPSWLFSFSYSPRSSHVTSCYYDGETAWFRAMMQELDNSWITAETVLVIQPHLPSGWRRTTLICFQARDFSEFHSLHNARS